MKKPLLCVTIFEEKTVAKNYRFRKYNTTIMPSTRVRFSNWPVKERLKKVLLWLVVLAIAYWYLFGNTGLIHLIQFKYRQINLEKGNAAIEDENRRASAEIQALRSW